MQIGFVTLFLAFVLWKIAECTALQKARRNGVRATLSNKVDPNFWPARGRRSSDHQARQTSDEEGPFWANRGRSLDAFVLDISPMWEKSMVEKGVFGNHVRTPEGDPKDISKGPFWANRGRAVEGDRGRATETGPFWANRGRSTESGPFWANRGRAADTGPFWANRGRATGDNDPFWANRGRSTDETDPFWANRGRSTDENDPFWANRGRSTEISTKNDNSWEDRDIIIAGQPKTQTKDEPKETLKAIYQDLLGRLPDDLKQDILFAEEPGFLETRVPAGRRAVENGIFWVSRGKRLTPDALSRYGRAHKPSRALDQLKDKFWPSRGKKSEDSKDKGTVEH